MNRSKHIMVAVFLVFAMALVAGAQMGGLRQTPLPRGIFRPVVGEGAVYEVRDSTGTVRSIEFDIVGKDSVDGKDAYWMEWTVTGTPMGDMIMKTQMVLDAGNTLSGRTILQMGSNPPMEMPAGMMGRGSAQPQPADIRTTADDLGSESVTTPAGTFACEHFKMKDGTGEAWISEKVSPFGLVKSQGKDSSLVLVKLVTGATDKITGTPQPFNPAAMMGRR
jgi:hypothetical protein